MCLRPGSLEPPKVRRMQVAWTLPTTQEAGWSPPMLGAVRAAEGTRGAVPAVQGLTWGVQAPGDGVRQAGLSGAARAAGCRQM